jgi:hypothetical protein
VDDQPGRPGGRLGRRRPAVDLEREHGAEALHLCRRPPWPGSVGSPGWRTRRTTGGRTGGWRARGRWPAPDPTAPPACACRAGRGRPPSGRGWRRGAVGGGPGGRTAPGPGHRGAHHQVGVTGEELADAVDHDIGAEVERALRQRRGEGVVHRDEHPEPVGAGHQGRQVGDLHPGVRGALEPEQRGPGAGVEGRCGVGDVDRTRLPPPRSGRGQQLPRPRVAVAEVDDRRADGQDLEHGGHGGHAGREGQCRAAALQRGERLLEGGPRRVAVTPVAGRATGVERRRETTGVLSGPSGVGAGRPADTATVAGAGGRRRRPTGTSGPRSEGWGSAVTTISGARPARGGDVVCPLVSHPALLPRPVVDGTSEEATWCATATWWWWAVAWPGSPQRWRRRGRAHGCRCSRPGRRPGDGPGASTPRASSSTRGPMPCTSTARRRPPSSGSASGRRGGRHRRPAPLRWSAAGWCGCRSTARRCSGHGCCRCGPSRRQPACWPRSSGSRRTGLTGTTVGQWCERSVADPVTRRLLLAVVRVATYADAPQHLDAGAALHQVQRSLHGSVRYLDGGWQRLVDQLRTIATGHGVDIRTGARVRVVRPRVDGGLGRRGRRRRHGAARTVVLAGGGPAHAAALLGGPGGDARRRGPTGGALHGQQPRRVPRRPVGRGTEVRARHRRAALPLVARPRCGPRPGRRLARVTAALPPGRRGRRPGGTRSRLEAMLDGVRPGWREHVVQQRFRRRAVVTHDVPGAAVGGLGGRPTTTGSGVPGVLLAGDWVGPAGMLADAGRRQRCGRRACWPPARRSGQRHERDDDLRGAPQPPLRGGLPHARQRHRGGGHRPGGVAAVGAGGRRRDRRRAGVPHHRGQPPRHRPAAVGPAPAGDLRGAVAAGAAPDPGRDPGDRSRAGPRTPPSSPTR